jgi:hypothetical protein
MSAAVEDWVALFRATDLTQPPQPTRLTPRQRGEAVRFLTAVGLPASAIVERTGLARRTVYRWRSRLRATGRLA